MSDAYKCDRCLRYFDGCATTMRVGMSSDGHLCEGCYEDFKRWLRREPTSVLQPKDERPEQPHMQQMAGEEAAYMNSCPRCWQHGFERMHGPMEVCPYAGRL